MSDAPSAPDPLAALASHVMHCDCDIQGVGGAPRNHTDPACVELQNELAAYVRDLEAQRNDAQTAYLDEERLREAAEGERDDAENGCAILRGHYDNAIKGATHWRERLAALEAALRGLEGACEDPCFAHCGDYRTEPGHYPECEAARAALAPPERSRVAAPPEPPRADDDPRGA